MQHPRTSIVILTKNAGQAFHETLQQIYSQQVDFTFEVIIVDSGSVDKTIDTVKKFPVRVYHISPKEFNFGLTRNYGFSLAGGDYIVTMSQDVVPCNTSWLQNLVNPFSGGEEVVAVQGLTRVPNSDDVFYWEKKERFDFTVDTKKWLNNYKVGLSFVNCAIRKKFWAKHQIPYTPFSEDKLFQRFIYEDKKEIVISYHATCYHGHQYRFASLVKRLMGEGLGWKYAGMDYTFKDCLADLTLGKRMVKEGYRSLRKGEIMSVAELLFPVLRPICVYVGNRRKPRSSPQEIL